MLTKKKSCHKLPTVLLKSVRGRNLSTVKINGNSQMVIAFTITEKTI